MTGGGAPPLWVPPCCELPRLGYKIPTGVVGSPFSPSFSCHEKPFILQNSCGFSHDGESEHPIPLLGLKGWLPHRPDSGAGDVRSLFEGRGRPHTPRGSRTSPKNPRTR